MEDLIMERLQKQKLDIANIFCDGVVLQRNKPIKLWGKAHYKDKVIVTLQGQSYETIVDEQNEWQVVIGPMEAGGPYEVEIKTEKESILIRDILFGDVWLCSGQSNMELPIARVMEKYREEVNRYENQYIRMFRVETTYDFNAPRADMAKGKWYTVNHEDVQKFTAVGYFFAKELYKKYHVPIGLIDTSVGGSHIEAWLSEEILEQFPSALDEIKVYKDEQALKQILEQDQSRVDAWEEKLQKLDKGLKEASRPWYENTGDLGEWKTIHVPDEWSLHGIEMTAGVVWFRREIELTEKMLHEKTRLFLGTIIESDIAYINGIEVGRTGYQYPPRIYEVPEGVLKIGKNIIVIRVEVKNEPGRFTLDKFYGLESGGKKVDLSGEWQYRIGAEIEPLAPQIFLPSKPLGLYNGILHALRNVEIKGVIWYQGESNIGNAGQYQRMFTSLIKEWRSLWCNSELPFLYVQLTSIGAAQDKPCESQWAEVREAQLQVLELPYTAMAVTIDVGEWNDLHPLSKKEIGQRLALGAQAMAYQEDVVYSGPIPWAFEVEDNRVMISFNHVGSGLYIKGSEELREFAISGDGKHYIWAKALIKDNKVIIWNEEVRSPKAIRYAWSDNPTLANLCNKEGLLASPFQINWN